MQYCGKPVKRIACLLTFLAFWSGCSIHAQPAGLESWDQSSDLVYKQLNGIDRYLHREIRQTDGSRRVTSPLESLVLKYDRSPRNDDCPVYFGQASVQFKFSETGRFPSTPLKVIAAKLRAGEIKAEEIAVQFMWINGKRVTINNRHLTVLYMAGMRPTKLIDRTANPAARSPGTLLEVLRRLEGMAGKSSTEMLIRRRGLGRDGRLKEATDWDAPISEIVSMPDDLLQLARSCQRGEQRQGSSGNGTQIGSAF
jgi:hypothetical protein